MYRDGEEGKKLSYVAMDAAAAAAAAAATGAKRRRRGSADSQRPSLRKTSYVATGPFSYDASLQTPTAAAADKTQEGIAKKKSTELVSDRDEKNHRVAPTCGGEKCAQDLSNLLSACP